jgi:hypothetical protein
MKKIRLNLASRPVRNRRLFLALNGGIGLAFFVSALLGLTLFFRYAWKARGVQAELVKVAESIQTAQSSQRRFLARTQEAVKMDQERVNFVNSIILQKSFSWNELLSRLEDSLPDSSFIVSLAPAAVEEARVLFRLKVVSANLDDLLTLVNKLRASDFNQIRVESEDLNDRGQLTSEISVNYVRHLL